jgi:hypothetical protein
MPEPYARVPDVNQRVEFDITQGWKGAQPSMPAGSDSDHWVVPPSVWANLRYPERMVASACEQELLPDCRRVHEHGTQAASCLPIASGGNRRE